MNEVTKLSSLFSVYPTKQEISETTFNNVSFYEVTLDFKRIFMYYSSLSLSHVPLLILLQLLSKNTQGF